MPADQSLLGEMQSAPPLYGRHRLDRVYEGIDANDFLTPCVLSGVATPFRSASRTASMENLFLPELSDAAHSTALASRLQNLELNGSNNNRSQPGNPQRHSSQDHVDESSSSNSHSHSISYTFDGLGGAESPPAAVPEYDMDALERMPSYATAIRTPAPRATAEPPTYASATSRPPSPSLQHPGRAHLRNEHNSTPRF